MEIHLLENRKSGGYVSFGSYWPRGEVLKNNFRLTGKQTIPVQSRVAAYWPDGSVKWAAHTADSSLMGDSATIEPGEGMDCQGIVIHESTDMFAVSGKRISLTIPKGGENIACDVSVDDRLTVLRIYPVLSLASGVCPAVVREVTLEEAGPLMAVFRFDGAHGNMPFAIRMLVPYDKETLSFEHTFFFGGDEEVDQLASMGLRFDAALSGAPYQRHIQYLTDGYIFHEQVAQLFHRGMKLDLLSEQMTGKMAGYGKACDVAAGEVPHWNHFSLTQDSAQHFVIRKQTRANLCRVDCRHGGRAKGTMAVAGTTGGLAITINDFWQKYPSGLEASNMQGDITALTAWFYSPEAAPYDFRHYDVQSYPDSCYEGFDYVQATAYGIAVTSRCTLAMLDGFIQADELLALNEQIQKPAVYVASPKYYHQYHAFGAWALPDEKTIAGQWIEQQLEQAFTFYKNEVDARNWYGLFDYGDFMHTYETVRHAWRYDVGGYAWDNTELVPTYWLWIYFLRTGREDVYTLAEALCRHTADVDSYHFGPMKGVGSRHNVRHWGCSCKEPRVAMAGHHRFLYYLGCDRRVGDAMDDVKDADIAMGNLHHFTESDKLTIRSGPDWSSFVSNWMTVYERTLNTYYRDKIQNGIDDLYAAPLKLTSGPEFGYDAETGHLAYIGENDDTINMHLQACMGGFEIWIEVAEMLCSDKLCEMLKENGLYFFRTPEERCLASNGLIQNRRFGTAIYSGELQAYAANVLNNMSMARDIWRELLGTLARENDMKGFAPVPYAAKDDGSRLMEIPYITTNYVAQWCVKVMVSMALIGDALPDTLEDFKALLTEKPIQGRFFSA